MKTKQIKGQCDILLMTGHYEKLHRPFEMLAIARHYNKKLCKQDWQFHCRLSEMTEDEAAELVEGNNNGQNDTMWRDYKADKEAFFVFTKEIAREAVQSLLEANGVLKENPFGKEKPYFPEQGSYEALMCDAPTFKAMGELLDK